MYTAYATDQGLFPLIAICEGLDISPPTAPTSIFSVFQVPDLLPAAAIVAICLFILKEAFEQIRRRGERQRKRAAIRDLLQHEVAENYRVLNSLFFAIDYTAWDPVADDERDTILVQHGGRLRYERLDGAGSAIAGNPLPPPRVAEFNRLLQPAAELDKKLYSKIRAGYDQVFELEHLHQSFVDYLMGRAEEREMWFDGFRQYAFSLYDDIEKGLRDLYRVLAGRELHYKGLRRSPAVSGTTGSANANANANAAPVTPSASSSLQPAPEIQSGQPDAPSPRPSLEDDFYVVDYQHIDDFRCVSPLSEAVGNQLFDDISAEQRGADEDALRKQLADLFAKAGWEGDGEIGCMFLAPCFTDSDTTWCETVYHVKQSNNGTSWLAIPKRLRLKLPRGLYAE